MKEKKSTEKVNYSKTTVRQTNVPLHTFLYGLVRAYFFLCGVRMQGAVRSGMSVEGPAIVLCNHGSFVDFVFAGSMMRKTRPHFVVARLYFYHKALGWLLRQLGCFPKSMFALDMESTKNCLRVLKEGRVLAMMPEARLSTAGRFEDIQKNTYSFLKKCGVPVYTVKLSGDYLADPKWGKGFRRGAVIEASMELLFTAEQIRALPAEEIGKAVEDRLRYDEYGWLEEHPHIHYRSRRLAEGLENILTVCPKCGESYTISTKGHNLFCKNCGKLTALSDRYAFDEGFPFRHPGQWYDWQKERMGAKIAADPAFSISAEVELRLPGRGNSLTRHGGNGVCTLDRSGLTYEGTRDGEQVQLHFTLERIYRLLFGAGVNFEIYDGSEILYFVPENKQSCADWYMASMILHDEAAAQNRER